MSFLKIKTAKAEKDFSPEDLPHSRKEQFPDILKNNTGLLFRIAGLLFLFSLPFLAVYSARKIIISSAYGSMDSDEFSSFQSLTEIICRLAFALTLMVYSVGLSGAVKVMKHVIWNEPVFFKEDFFSGIKENVGRYLLVSFFVGMMHVAAYAAVLFYGDIPVVGYIPISFNVFIFFPISVVFMYVNSYYRNGFWKNVSLSFRIYFRSFLLCFLNFISVFIFYFLDYIPINSFIIFGIVVLLDFFYVPLWFVASYLNQISIFDRKINILYFPDYAYRGLVRKNKTEEKK